MMLVLGPPLHISSILAFLFSLLLTSSSHHYILNISSNLLYMNIIFDIANTYFLPFIFQYILLCNLSNIGFTCS